MSLGEIPYDDAHGIAEALRQIRDLPCTDGSGRSAKEARNAMYEYCYAKRDQLEHHLGEGERMLKAVLADIERLHGEECQELGISRRTLMRRATDRRGR